MQRRSEQATAFVPSILADGDQDEGIGLGEIRLGEIAKPVPTRTASRSFGFSPTRCGFASSTSEDLEYSLPWHDRHRPFDSIAGEPVGRLSLRQFGFDSARAAARVNSEAE